MGQVAYKATIFAVGETSTDTSGKFSKTNRRNVFKIKKTPSGNNNRFIDPSKPVIVTGPGELGEMARLNVVDSLFGLIKISANPDIEFFENELTVSYSYFPVTEFLGANSYTVDLTGDILPDTTFSKARTNGGFMTKTYGLNDVSITLGGFYGVNEVVRGMKTIRASKEDREKIAIEILSPSGTESIRGIFVAESINLSGDMSALETEEYTFQLAGDAATNFSWRSENV